MENQPHEKPSKELLKDIIDWDVVNWSKALPFWEQHADKELKNLTCLELGGRKGGPSLWLALKENQVVCSDLESPEAIAAMVHQKYLVNKNISYKSINATEIGEIEFFDVVIFKSILGGISRDNQNHIKQQVIDEIYKALKPGGLLLFAENMESSFLHRFMRKRFVKWGAGWNYLKLSETKELFKNFSSFQYKTVGFFGAFGRTEKQRQLLGKMDGFFEKLIPSSKRYILIGVLKK